MSDVHQKKLILTNKMLENNRRKLAEMNLSVQSGNLYRAFHYSHCLLSDELI
jgi:hypothetical protein